MADSRIKGITVEIGGDTSQLSKALSGVNTQLRGTTSQLKDVERLLKLDPGNVELLEQKQRLLSGAIEETEEKLDSLREAEKQVQAQFERGEVSQAQYNGLQREIAATEISLRDLREQARQTDKSISGIDESPVEDVEQAADQAADALEDAGKEASNFGDYLKAGAVIEGIKGIGSAISDLSEETQEYRKIMGSLEVSSENAGYSAEQTEQTYRQLYGVLGDDQTAATTTANLQALGMSQRELTELTNAAIGAWATYGDSIPIDGLAESVNETIRAGQVTGTFADVLNWGSKEGETFGVTMKEATEENKEWNESVADCETAEDYFNLALQEAGSQAERQNLVMQALASQGLAEAGQAWRDNNADLVAANEAQATFAENAAELSEKVAPITNEVKEGFNDIFEAILQLMEGIDFEAIAQSIDSAFTFFVNNVVPVVADFLSFLIENGDLIVSILVAIAGGLAAMKLAEFAGNISSVINGTKTLSSTFPLLGNAISILTKPIFLVGGAITALVLLFATKGKEIKAILDNVDAFLQNVFATDFSESFGFLGQVLNAFLGVFEAVWNTVHGVLDGITTFVQCVFSGNWNQAWDGIKQIFGSVMNGISQLGQNLITGILRIFTDGLNGLKNLLMNLVSYIGGVFSQAWSNAWNGVKNIFSNILGGLGDTAKSIFNGAIGAINGLITGINWVIGKVNSISIDLPFGAGHIGFNIPKLSQIAYLARGGILTQGNAIVGEAGPELLTMSSRGAVVQPLTNNTTNNSLGGITVNVYGAPGQDISELADLVANRVEAAVQRQKAVWA